jgi:hypothetical protein
MITATMASACLGSWSKYDWPFKNLVTDVYQQHNDITEIVESGVKHPNPNLNMQTVSN